MSDFKSSAQIIVITTCLAVFSGCQSSRGVGGSAVADLEAAEYSTKTEGMDCTSLQLAAQNAALEEELFIKSGGDPQYRAGAFAASGLNAKADLQCQLEEVQRARQNLKQRNNSN